MKKINFLNGINAMFALAVVALATTFTSCEKEEFNVNVEPVNAQATISPIVLYVDLNTGVSKDVTSEVTPTYSQGPVFTGNPTLAATTATVSVTYAGISATATVQVPALQAGMFATLTPTITLIKPKTETETTITVEISDPVAGDVVTVKADRVGEERNTTDYWFNRVGKYTKKSGNKVVEQKIIAANMEEHERIERIFKALGGTYQEELMEIADVPVYAHSMTQILVTYTVATTEYKIVKKTTTTTTTKADGVKEEVIAKAKVESYTTTKAEVKHSIPIPDHNHAPAGHGHGHGHGDGGNAGGGIVVPE